MFRAAIFDMDGLLIDSEPIWRNAERAVFATVGIEITDEMAAVTAPMTTREAAEHWFRVRPWPGKSVADMEAAVVARVAEEIQRRGRAMPGVNEVLSLCNQFGWQVALASNSPESMCHLVLAELGISEHFSTVVSAEHVARGKPDPAIYLHSAKLLGVPPEDCLVFEDSPTGVRAARAAGMCVVAVPPEDCVFSADARPHARLRALHEFGREHAARLWAGRMPAPRH